MYPTERKGGEAKHKPNNSKHEGFQHRRRGAPGRVLQRPEHNLRPGLVHTRGEGQRRGPRRGKDWRRGGQRVAGDSWVNHCAADLPGHL